jgi:hypothetical protein
MTIRWLSMSPTCRLPHQLGNRIQASKRSLYPRPAEQRRGSTEVQVLRHRLAIVAGNNGSKRSVALELFEGGRCIGIGNVTIPSNHKIPAGGDLVEMTYLYAYPGGSLYQPVYVGKQDDLVPAACTIRQLKFKPADEEF